MDVVVAYFFIRQSRLFLPILAENKTLISWAVLATMSGLWSLAPGLSIYHGLQFLMTLLAGVLLCLYADLEDIIQLYFFGLLLIALVSFAVCVAGLPEAFSINHDWKGVLPHKNMLGYAMTCFVITGLCLWAARWRPMLSVGAVALGLTLLIFSRSGTALVSFFLCLASFGVALAVRQGNRVIGVIGGLALAALAIGIFFLGSEELDVVSSILGALGKDKSLTERTTLWDFGLEQFWQEPLLGVGFKAYWENPLTSAATLRSVLKQELSYFHNNFLDIAVGLGVAGLLVFAVGLALVIFHSLRRYFAAPNFINLWPVLFVVNTLVTCTVEGPIFVNHSLAQLFLLVCVSARPRTAVSRHCAGRAMKIQVP